MTKRSDAWMPLYIGDYLADTGRLTTEGHGAYLLLIMDYWRNGAPPDDDETLAAITKLPVARWRKLRLVLAPLFQIDAGLWHHKRVDEELTKASGVTAERSAAGRAGAEKRWGKRDGKDDSKPHGSAMANAMANGSQNDAPSPSPSQDSSLRSESPPVVPRKPKAEPKGTRLPADWQPGHELLVWAANHLPERLDVERETEKFRNHFAAAPGAKGRKTDWPATWRNWMMNSADRMPGFQRQPEHRNGFAAMQADQKRATAQGAFTLDGTAREIHDGDDA